MRHRKSVKKLGRTAAHRKALLANLSAALFEQKHIQTTEAKAKETRKVSERLITLAKKETLHARRLALKRLRSKKVVNILFDKIAPFYADRVGGYTRVIKLGQRQGDGASMAVLELVGYEMASKKKKEKEAKLEAKKKQEKGEKSKEPPPVPETVDDTSGKTKEKKTASKVKKEEVDKDKKSKESKEKKATKENKEDKKDKQDKKGKNL